MRGVGAQTEVGLGGVQVMVLACRAGVLLMWRQRMEDRKGRRDV